MPTGRTTMTPLAETLSALRKLYAYVEVLNDIEAAEDESGPHGLNELRQARRVILQRMIAVKTRLLSVPANADLYYADTTRWK